MGDEAEAEPFRPRLRACRRACRGDARRRIRGPGRRARPRPRRQPGLPVFCSTIKHALGYDDSLDAFGIHGVGGIVGAIGTAIVVNPALGGAGVVDCTTCARDGDISTCDVAAYALGAQLITQIKAVAVTLAWSGIGSAIVFFGIKLLTGGRVAKEIEVEGLDLREHGEAAYHA